MTTAKPNNTSLILRIVSDIEKKLDDFEMRIRELEQARWKGAWLQAILTAAITAAVVAIVMKGLA
jgi:hypothetical protein